ncbi:MAG TPA: cation diffusion facilitator family transporter [Pseudobdellovibrionaceae bacterium]|jgi:cobalt-zinc-cadmium efflux system protein
MSPNSHHAHSHSHAHSHGQSHAHSHAAPRNFDKAFAIGIFLNLIFVIAEAGYGLVSKSLALVADASHNFSDVVGLVLAWAALWLSRKKPSARFTYGLRRSSILAALTNAVLLLIAVGGITWEALRRLWEPTPIQTETVMVVACVGILINGVTAYFFMSGRKEDINIRGAYLHMATDALVSVGVVVAGFLIQQTQWLWVDPAISIFIALIITVGTWDLLKESVNMAMDAVPAGIHLIRVREYFTGIQGVQEVHDLHVWPMSTTETALTVHLVMPKELQTDELLAKISKDLKENFKIDHPTIQIESGDSTHFECALKPDEVV